jgi:chromatin remodeling complex protein RSC6
MSASKTAAKRVTKKTEDAPAVAAPVAAAPAAAPAKATKAVSKKADAPAAPAPVAAAPVAATPAPVVEEVRLEAEVKAVTASLLAVRETLSGLITEAKKLEKKAAKLQKVADKRRRRQKVAEGEEGKPARISIFQVPVALSPELCKFMGRPAGSLESRSNVTKHITNYVREKGLKNKHDIVPDTSLRSLLNLKEGEQLTYFNLQKHLNVHYPKSAKAVAAAAAATQ